MNRRLQQFLELESLTPSRLADILGIQRSGISHILSGRNKPGYDFLYKFLQKFPQINAEWLITGKGKPYKENISPTLQVATKNETDTDPVLQFEPDNSSELFDSEKDIIESSPVEEPSKRIIRATIFYSDGSFKELFPHR